MTRKEIIDGLKFTVDMFMFDPSTGETYIEPQNYMDKITIDACKGAIKELQDNSYELWKESYEVEHERNFRLKEKIKTLEQESILDKIREEINGMYRVILKGTSEDDWAVKWNDCLDEVLQIIDKYRESEG